MNLFGCFHCARRGRRRILTSVRSATDRYLDGSQGEAERVAEQHDQVARTADNQTHEYLRYAVLRVLERGGPPPVGLDADRQRNRWVWGGMRRCSTVWALQDW